MTEKLFAVTFHVRWSEILGLAQLAPHLAPVSCHVLDIEAPEPEPETKKRGRKPARETKPGKVVLELMSNGRVYALEEIGRALADAGLSPTGAGTIASQLTKEGDTERAGAGAYRLAQGAAL